jgi:ABC-type bacteriocin/lantibiotic exporter with double-glycine peptidase domain
MNNLFSLLEKKEKFRFFILQFFWLFCSALYSFNIFLYATFLTSLSDNKIVNFDSIEKLKSYIILISTNYYLLIFGIIILLVSFLSNSTYYILLKKSALQTYSVSERIQKNILKYFLNQDFEIFIKDDFSKKVSVIMNDSNKVGGLINTLGNIGFFLGNFIFSISILLFINFKIALLSFFILFFLYFFLFYLSKNKLSQNSQTFSNVNNIKTQILINCFQGIREIKIYRFENFQLEEFKKISKDLVVSRLSTRLLSETSKIYTETIFFIFLFLLVVYSFYNSLLQSSVSQFVIAFIMCLFRIVPSFQYFYSISSSFKDSQESINKTFTQVAKSKFELIQKVKQANKNFNNLELKNVNFYHREKKILCNLNLKINTGDKILISGKTGSGKSTLLDVISGLRKINDGYIILDNKNINDYVHQFLKISYVPQNSYFVNKSIVENIGLGQPTSKLDLDKIRNISKYLLIEDLLSENKPMGDFGNFFSGGQKQRIALARCLYFDSELILFDEATSALDKQTEKSVIQNLLLNNPNKTLIFVSHSDYLKVFFKKALILEEGSLREI